MATTNTVALLIALLRAELAISNIYGEIPEGASRPIVRIEESGGGPQPSSLSPNRITTADLQISVWAETKEAAWNLASSISDAIHSLPRSNPVHSTHGTLVTTNRQALVYLPDEDWPASGRPGPRYEQTVRIRAHG